MKLSVKDTNNGFIVEVEDSLRKAGLYIFKNTEIIAMLEFIGNIINDKKVKVEER